MRESQKLFPDSFCILFYMRDFVPLFYGIRRLLPAGHTEGILTAFPVSKAVVTWTDQPISTDGVQVSAIIACQCMSRKRLTCRLQGIRAEMRLRLREKGRRFGACHFPKIRNAHKNRICTWKECRSARRGGIECCFRPDACCHTLSAFLRHSWPTRCRPEETLCSRTATVFCLLRGHVKQAQIGLADPTWLYSCLKQHRLIDGNLGLISAAP